jgi:hypothetical protein
MIGEEGIKPPLILPSKGSLPMGDGGVPTTITLRYPKKLIQP